MMRRVTQPLSVLLLSIVVFWPVWRWYAGRLLDGSGETVGLVAILTLLGVLIRHYPQPPQQTQLKLTVPGVLLLIYLAGIFYLPALLQAVLAVLVLAVLVSQIWYGQTLHPGITGLMLLCLPILASLQFFLGYPLRVVIGILTEALLRMNGFDVNLEGVTLHWAETAIEIDAPCSGVKMLWVGLYLCFALICMLRLSFRRSMLLAATSVACIILGNTLRAGALFFSESGVLYNAPWMHNGLGMISFVLTALAIVFSARLIQSGGAAWRCTTI
ncbi:MAG: exosortase/archaeosortase family protein [Gammaproteobacteria bacterium]|nr:exosortase/archaeosortase family protein [Gammaproteobacteria bacterium]MDH5652588.1 exosortase/archaeosortase family protein [Gammaproteobacteria bacterium]